MNLKVNKKDELGGVYHKSNNNNIRVSTKKKEKKKRNNSKLIGAINYQSIALPVYIMFLG